MKTLLTTAFFVLLAVSAATHLHAAPQAQPQAQAAVEQRQPVMILRFNQRNVHYEKHLASIIRRAQQIKPDVQFDVVSILPSGGERSFWQKKTTARVKQLTESFARNGVSGDRIHTSQKIAPVSSDEIHIFVR